MVLPRSGGYWCDDGSDTAAAPADSSQTASCKLELDETARCYRRFFVGKVSRNIFTNRVKKKTNNKRESELSGGLRNHRVTHFTIAHRQFAWGSKVSAVAPLKQKCATFPFFFSSKNPRWHQTRHADFGFPADKTAPLYVYTFK